MKEPIKVIDGVAQIDSDHPDYSFWNSVDVRVIDEITGETLIEYYELSQRQLDALYANVGVMQAVEILN